MARSPFAMLGRKASNKADQEKKNTGPDDDEDLDEAEKARRAKKAEEDSDDEEGDDDKKDKEDRDDAKASAARGRERARVRAILTSDPGLANPVAAAHMALDTDMGRGSAIAALTSLNAATGVPDFDPAGGGHDAAMAKAIVSAGAKARGEAPPVPPGRRQRMGYAEGYTPPAAPRRAAAADADGRPVGAAAQAIIDAGKKRRGEG